MAEKTEISFIQNTKAPYPSSWIDHLIQKIDSLPGPPWLFYVLAGLALTLLINVVLWIDGSVPYGSYGSIPGIFSPTIFYFVAIYHYLTRIGSRSLRTFHPLLNVDDNEITKIEYELTTIPRWLGWLTVPLGFLGSIPYLRGDPATWGDLVPQTPLPLVVAFAILGPFVATSFCLIFRSIRQLWAIRKLHAQVTEVNLLKLESAHAFSVLTARTGIGLILVVIISYIYDPSAAFSTGWDIFGYVIAMLVAVIVFVVPLLGMRDHLAEEKKRTLNETNDLLQATRERLHRKINNGDYDNLDGMETAINALIRERELTLKISVWPWDTGTIRGFASTLLLPVFLWLVTRLLGRLF